MAQDEQNEWDAAKAVEQILSDRAPIIAKAAQELGFLPDELAGILRSAPMQSSPQCLTLQDISTGESFSESKRTPHIEACELCTSVVRAMEEPAVPERVREFVAEARKQPALEHGNELADQVVLVGRRR